MLSALCLRELMMRSQETQIRTKENTALLDAECAELCQARQVAASAGCQLHECEILPTVDQAAPNRLV